MYEHWQLVEWPPKRSWEPTPAPLTDPLADNKALHHHVANLKVSLEKLVEITSTIDDAKRQLAYVHISLADLYQNQAEHKHLPELHYYCSNLHRQTTLLLHNVNAQHLALKHNKHHAGTVLNDARDITHWAKKLNWQHKALSNVAAFADRDIPWHVKQMNMKLSAAWNYVDHHEGQRLSDSTWRLTQNEIRVHVGELIDALSKFYVVFPNIGRDVDAIVAITGTLGERDGVLQLSGVAQETTMADVDMLPSGEAQDDYDEYTTTDSESVVCLDVANENDPASDTLVQTFLQELAKRQMAK